ncbi:hypothetical protein JEQ12_002959 [Ovis aries]|uniref:Uncharacterized protein n=1 Tax=Ovis aries TaxID=9940 RepID=A0A836A8L9_SHEEP|nr:hypothetical protein JEQ12_002959 [Ovis aries]
MWGQMEGGLACKDEFKQSKRKCKGPEARDPRGKPEGQQLGLHRKVHGESGHDRPQDAGPGMSVGPLSTLHSSGTKSPFSQHEAPDSSLGLLAPKQAGSSGRLCTSSKIPIVVGKLMKCQDGVGAQSSEMPLSAFGAHVKSTACLVIARLSFTSSIEMSAVDRFMRDLSSQSRDGTCAY